MTNNQPENTIAIEIFDDESNSFIYDANSNQIIDNLQTEPDCSVILSSEAYQLLLVGDTTAEEQIHAGNLKIRGNVSLLRQLGKAFRAKQS